MAQFGCELAKEKAAHPVRGERQETLSMLAAFRATVDTGRNSPRHVADASDKFLLAIGTYKDSASGRPCRNFAGGVIVFVAPHSSDLWTLGNQIVDARDNLATCTNRATGVAVAYRFNNTVDGSRELLPAVGANEQHFFVTVCRYLAGSISILAAPHIGDFRALSFQIVDTGNHLAVRARRATGVAAIHRMDDIANGSLKLLTAIRANKQCLFVAACSDFAGSEGVLSAPHGCNFRALSSHIIDAGDSFLGIDSVGVHSKLSFSSYFRGL